MPPRSVTGPVQVDSTKSEKCVGVRDFKKILEVLGVHWECVGSALRVLWECFQSALGVLEPKNSFLGRYLCKSTFT